MVDDSSELLIERCSARLTHRHWSVDVTCSPMMKAEKLMCSLIVFFDGINKFSSLSEETRLTWTNEF